MRLPEVLHITGDSESGLRRKIESGKFPKPVKIGLRSIAWPENEVQAYIADVIAERDEEART
ncbi:MAG: AlpA family phage regulatory protein [Pseudomonadota bacterium]